VVGREGTVEYPAVRPKARELCTCETPPEGKPGNGRTGQDEPVCEGPTDISVLLAGGGDVGGW